MQRGTYQMPPAQSPPLYHPVPQHISQVPNLRSPPPPHRKMATATAATNNNSKAHLKQERAEGPMSPFLDLPRELRDQIYRFALLSPEPIIISRHCEFQPGLLRTNRQLRNETLEIWFTENELQLEIHDLDLPLLVRFRQLLAKYRAPGVQNVVCRWRGECVWANVVKGLRMLHGDPGLLEIFPRSPSLLGQERVWRGVCCGADVVEGMKGEEWGDVDLVLMGVGKGLGVYSNGWV
ncbi:hypothetical protein B0A55_09028 [Friedmanniomyces simplex]|uniref:F-box domain-containing protein n=1 Tax=Friedmanniomyces simplex TaxID=329884 RepID=A0A4U0WVV5_9PEZI|nr:hypothetical protein B0A55_09028 [Friedmanniomyces simplex]